MFNKIMKRLNGHAVEAPSLAEALAQLARDRETTQAELATLNGKRRQLLLDDASDSELDKVERSIDRANVRLEKITLAEAPLRERLSTATAAERARRWEEHLAAHRAAAARFLAAAQIVIEAHAAVIAVVHAAQREGFAHEVTSGMPPTPAMNGNPICAPQLLEKFKSALTPAPRAPGRAPRGGIRHYGGGDPNADFYDPTRATAPRQTLQHPVMVDTMSSHELTASAGRMRAPRLPDDTEPLGEGEVRVVVLRSGFQSPDGPCHAGRRIRLPRDLALQALRGGAVEIVEDPARAAAERASDRTFRPVSTIADARGGQPGGNVP